MRRLLVLALMFVLVIRTSVFADTGTVSPYYGPTLQADVRSGEVTLAADGTGSWDLTAGGTLPPMGGTPDVTHIPQAMDTTNPLICNFTSRSTTTVAIKCFRTSLLGLLTGLLSGPVTGGKVNLIARWKAP